MCGIVGIFKADNTNFEAEAKVALTSMARAIAHRGPDGEGYWVDAEFGIGFGHRRLSVIDLSSAGAQPMVSASGRYVVVFNGEIYNHADLRVSLEDQGRLLRPWRGQSDTETLLASVDAWGLEKTLTKITGMFVIALWDRYSKVLSLARDRLGEKPLYYGSHGVGQDAVFLFGSELKALKSYPSFSADINRDALQQYMKLNYVPAPLSIYEGVSKLLPGHILTVSRELKTPQSQPFWSLSDVAEAGISAPFEGDASEAIESLGVVLRQSVARQVIADVPVGAFLSGGIDSSLIVALMQIESQQSVKTFTVGFSDHHYNEALYAKAVASHLGTDHTELYVTPQDAFDVISRLPQIFCEPFADSSQIPTFLVSRLARQQVKVSLSGDGGDELFAGYNRHFMTGNFWNKMVRVPLGIRRCLAGAVRVLPPSKWNSVSQSLQFLIPNSLRVTGAGDKMYKVATALEANTLDALYLDFVSHWQASDLVIGGREHSRILNFEQLSQKGFTDVQCMMLLDSISYMPDDILTKVDRSSMGVGLETRVPFLDHHVVEFAWRLPMEMKLRDGVGKWALRQLLSHHVPRELFERPKAGFGVPLGDWLRGPLRDWAEDLLDEKRIMLDGFFHSQPIRQRWHEHLSGKRNWEHPIWCVLMFQAWLVEQNG